MFEFDAKSIRLLRAIHFESEVKGRRQTRRTNPDTTYNKQATIDNPQTTKQSTKYILETKSEDEVVFAIAETYVYFIDFESDSGSPYVLPHRPTRESLNNSDSKFIQIKLMCCYRSEWSVGLLVGCLVIRSDRGDSRRFMDAVRLCSTKQRTLNINHPLISIFESERCCLAAWEK